MSDIESGDSRLKREPAAARTTGARDDRLQVEDRDLTADERRQMFRRRMFTELLPDLPDIPGYHTIWLTTENRGDSIQSRIRMGYELIKASDFPEFAMLSREEGAYAGCIMVNEMVAAKLPEDLYQDYMAIAHHEEPRAQEESLNQMIEMQRAEAQRAGAALVDVDDEGMNGMQELRRYAPSPRRFS